MWANRVASARRPPQEGFEGKIRWPGRNMIDRLSDVAGAKSTSGLMFAVP
jgi:hypothetical protein